jgi:tetratricopeptide (TPR) repeat protein
VPASFATGSEQRDWGAEAKASVARSVEVAPELAETQLARGMLAVQTGEWREAVQALVKALEIAPTYAHAHQYLGQLQCEAGNTKEGMERTKLAFDLEPSLLAALYDIARVHALAGDREEANRWLDMVDRNARFRHPTTQFRSRIAGWYGDIEAVRDVIDSLNPEDNDGFGQYVLGYARAIAGEASRAEVEAMTEKMIAQSPSPRFYTLMCQACVEIYAAIGEPGEALAYFIRAADSVLIDIEWTDRCPSLKAMRMLPGFSEARRKVRRRVQAMWSL